MSQVKGLLYFIKREGEDGKIGPILDALQIVVTSPLRDVLIEKGYYQGAAEEWEEFSHDVAGDVDGDNDYDTTDKAKIHDMNRDNINNA